MSDYTHSAEKPTGAETGPFDAERVIAAFLLGLGELGYEVPTNSYRAIVLRSGLHIEVFDDGKPAVRTYGTPAPVEEIAEILAPSPADGEALTAEALDALPVGRRVRDRVGDTWEKEPDGDWGFVAASAGPGEERSLFYDAEGLVHTWGPIS